MNYTNNIWHGRGRLVADPKIYKNDNAPSKAIFVLAINNKRKTRDNQFVDDVDFMQCELWDSASEIISKFGKGHEIEVIGQMRSYAVKAMVENEGEKTFYRTYCRVTSFTPLRAPKPKDNSQPE
jgi:single-stranded DNA-binding protein